MVFQDETGFSLHPRLGRGWAKVGQPFKVPTPSQHRQRLNLSGWVAPLLGRRGVIRTAKGDRQGFLKVLKHIRHRLKGYKVWIYVDRAPWHKGEEVRDYIRSEPQLRLRYLPPYQPALNMQERVWRRMRYEATTNRYFESLDDIWDALQTNSRRWSPNKVKQLCTII